MFSLANKVVVVTGATGVLGLQHCDAVARAGGTPVLLDLDLGRTTEAAERISQTFGVSAAGYVVDITKESAIKKNCAVLIERYGHIDGLVNNAANNPIVGRSGLAKLSRLEDFAIDQWNKDLEVGLTGAMLCIKHYGHEIARQGGSIVNISSDLGLIAPDQRLYKIDGIPETEQSVKPVTYSVIKTGLIGLTRYVATYWAKEGVRCNALCPGGIEQDQPIEFVRRVSERIPLGRMAHADEYQGAIVFLLSDASSYITGAVLAADGGRSAW